MLADAIKAETYRLYRTPSILFWSVLFLPAITLVGGVIGSLFLAYLSRAQSSLEQPPAELAVQAANLADGLMLHTATFDNPVTVLFILLGGAAIFANDYRWETWRLMAPRNTRINLLASKIIVAIGLTFAALVVSVASALIVQMMNAIPVGAKLTFSFPPEAGKDFVLALVLSFTRVLQVLVLALLAATLTRSLLATLIVPIVVSIAQIAAPGTLNSILMLIKRPPNEAIGLLLSPSNAVAALEHANASTSKLELAMGTSSMVMWTLIPLALAFLVFVNQDMSKE